MGERLQRSMNFERLEDRRVMATFLVTSLADAGLGTIRWAIDQANGTDGGDEIVFGEAAYNSGTAALITSTIDPVTGTISSQYTVQLTSGAYNITGPLRILGSGSRKLEIAQTRPNQRIFTIDDGDDNTRAAVEISGITLSGGNITGNGDDRRGGAIHSVEALRMVEAVVTGNSASQGGGAIWAETGSLTLSRSVISNNSAGNVGGGIALGNADDENDITATITNSTISGNSVGGGANDDYPGGYGGGIFMRGGGFRVINCTIVGNSAAAGGGIAVWGAITPDTEEGDPPPPPAEPNVFFSNSIVYDNMADDVANVGMQEDPEDDNATIPLEPLIASGGFNIIEVFGMGLTRHADDLPEGTDPEFETPFADDWGGSTDVFMISATSPAIDAAGEDEAGDFDQRGRHFDREFAYDTGGKDIGSVERQEGLFIVDELYDEVDGEGQTAGIFQIEDFVLGTITLVNGGGDAYESLGEFTIREALAFARKNGEPAIVQFYDGLRSREFEEDPGATPSPATIRLSLGALLLRVDAVIVGPTTFILEIDANYSDLTPENNDGLGSRVMVVDDGDPSSFLDVQISSLTFMGGDINHVFGGGAILSNENLTLVDSTVKDNYSKTSGGGIAVRAGTLALSGSTLENNRAVLNGGALHLESTGGTASLVTVSNSTFSANSADTRGGAIANINGDLLIEYSTITLNMASTTQGSGVWTANGANASTEIKGSIISGNSISDVSTPSGATAMAKVVSSGHNFVGAGNVLGNFNKPGDVTGNTNPMLEPLMITGGLTETHRPKTGSPIIDAGDPAFAAPPDFDQRGPDFARVFDGDGDSVARIDIGAYELQGSTFVVSTSVDGFDGNFTTGNLSLREAVHLANLNPLFDTVTFDPILILFAPSFFMSGAGLTIDQPATIEIKTSMDIIGPGSSLLELAGSPLHPLMLTQGPQRVFTVNDGSAGSTINVKISGLSMRDGESGSVGGTIASTENLTLDDMIFINNRTVIYDPLLTGLVTGGLHGGAIYQEGGSLTVNTSLFSANSTGSPESNGGAIAAVNAQVVIFDTQVSGNFTDGGGSRGGGIAIKGGTLTVNQGTITGNNTFAGLADGGGVFIDSATALFEESALAGNYTFGSNAEGGALAVVGATSQVGLEKDTVLSFNRTEGTGSSGGALFVGGGVVSVNNATLIENTATGTSASGGGAAAGLGGTLRFNTVNFQNNRATGLNGHGGAVANLSGTILIRNSTLSGNQAVHGSANGGAVWSDTANSGVQLTTVLNSTLSGNSAGNRGGGLFNADGRTEIKHSTITNNSVPFFNNGSGVASQGNGTTTTAVLSSIIAGNVGAAGGTGSDINFVDAPFTNSFQSQGYNVIGTGNALAAFTGTGDKTGITAPLLGPLANNGGPTRTHAVLAGSPAVNAGSPAFNPTSFTPPLTTDQRGVGFPRVVGGRIDAGAFESALSAFSADFDLDGDVDGRDFLAWQRGVGINAGATKAQGDANGDGRVNSADLTLLKAQFGGVSSEAAMAPLSVSGGEETAPAVYAPSMLAAVTEAPAASAATTSASTSTTASNPSGVGFVAGAGVPGATRAARPSYRPPVERRAAVDAVYSARGAAASSAATMPADEAEFTIGADATGDEAASEDAVFALLGDGLL